MTKKTIIFDTDDESKGHYPSDEAYAPLEVGKVYNVTEDVANKSIMLSPVDANSSLPTMKLGQLALEIDTKNTSVGGPLLTGTTIIKEQGATSLVALMTDGDIFGPAWGGSLTQPEKLTGFIKRSIEASVQGDLSSGWTRLNNGLLLQWGGLNSKNNYLGNIVFPTAFTNPCFFVPRLLDFPQRNDDIVETLFATNITTGQSNDRLTNASFHCYKISSNGGISKVNNWDALWFAIGY